jgi:CheY-like chemotaxis protein
MNKELIRGRVLGHGDGGSPVIYIIDDEPMLLDLARGVLEAEGYRVKTYRNPSEALKEFRRASQRPALILTDYQMSEMNGLELTAACRRLNPGQRVILVSGTVDTGSCSESMDPDLPNRFLPKPYTAESLGRLVHELLRAHSPAH